MPICLWQSSIGLPQLLDPATALRASLPQHQRQIDLAGAVVAVEVEDAVVFANEGVHIAVPVYVHEGGFAVVSHIHAVEGVTGTGDKGEVGIGGRAGVAVEVEDAVVFADEGVQIAVAVNAHGRGPILQSMRNRGVVS